MITKKKLKIQAVGLRGPSHRPTCLTFWERNLMRLWLKSSMMSPKPKCCQDDTVTQTQHCDLELLPQHKCTNLPLPSPINEPQSSPIATPLTLSTFLNICFHCGLKNHHNSNAYYFMLPLETKIYNTVCVYVQAHSLADFLKTIFTNIKYIYSEYIFNFNNTKLLS